MGVHGLWRLIEPSGKPVPLETLENKVLAVDISIWLHQAVKGFQDARGGSVPNAHLLGIYHRICKLLYFKIKPVFVFDGGVPVLKKQTIAKRSQAKLKDLSKADEIQKQLLNTLLKHTAVSKVITEKIEASIGLPKVSTRPKKDDIYILPPGSELDSTVSSSDEETYSEDTTSESSPTKQWDVHNIDMNSVHFKSLPVDVRHEILTDLKETRKQSSWGRLHELPKVSDDFSEFQMRRLLKRQAVQTALEDAEKEMGGKSLSLAELESILKDQGVLTNQNLGKRIASDETTKYLLVKDVKKAIEEARQKESEKSAMLPTANASNETADKIAKNEDVEVDEKHPVSVPMGTFSEELLEGGKSKAEEEYDEDLKRAIALSLECTQSTNDLHREQGTQAELPFTDNFKVVDFASSSSDEETLAEKVNSKMSSAQSYMLEYSGLTPNEISKILGSNKKPAALKPKKPEIKLSKDFIPSLPTVTENNVAMDNLQEPGGKCEDSVEIMSTSDSDDSEQEAKRDPAKVLDVFIDPTTDFQEEEDLFADVFSTAPTTGHPGASEPDVSGPDPFPKNDLFSLKDKPPSSSENIALISENVKHKIDIVKTVAVPKVVQTEENGKYVKAQSSNSSEQTDHSSLSSQRKAMHEAESSAKTAKAPPMTEQELRTLKDQLQVDKVNLITEKSTRERMASNITDQMYQEAQELLELFGVPYVVAPMEAEAQCAFLDTVDLIDGTITDDSDVWLFGGKTVYKNFFNQSKYVMEFKAENIQHHFKLTREQMILLALLVGSDYTVGLQGVGPVTAMEILAAFPPSKGKASQFSLNHQDLLSGLKEFRSWFTKGKSSGPGRSSLKGKLKNVAFTENFPSIQVVQAYLEPTVENSKEVFSWGKPNALALLEYARDKFGWTKTKAEEILNPVLKQLEESKHQKSILDYFKTNFKVHSGEAESKMSKRVKSAINNMGKDPAEILTEELQQELGKNPPARKRQPRKKQSKKAPEFSSDTAHSSAETTQKDPESNLPKTNKANLKKLKSAPKEPSDLPSTSGTQLNDEEPVSHETVTDKIDRVRRRRKLLEIKAAADVKKPKVPKEKPTGLIIPKDLEADEEMDLLNKVIKGSRERVEEINKELLENLEKVNTGPIKVVLPGPSNMPSSTRRPANRPTRIPKKETIPQKERDKTAVLRNKLKAIEVFRKGKRGPGFVPKRNSKKRLPKTEAELSESSDE